MRRIFPMAPSLASFMCPNWGTLCLFGKLHCDMMFLSLGPILCPSKLSVKSEDINSERAGETGCSCSCPTTHQKVQLTASLVFLKSKYILPCFYLFFSWYEERVEFLWLWLWPCPNKTIISYCCANSIGECFFFPSSFCCRKCCRRNTQVEFCCLWEWGFLGAFEISSFRSSLGRMRDGRRFYWPGVLFFSFECPISPKPGLKEGQLGV